MAAAEEGDAAGLRNVAPGGRVVRTVSASLGGELTLGAEAEASEKWITLDTEPFPVRARHLSLLLPLLRPTPAPGSSAQTCSHLTMVPQTAHEHPLASSRPSALGGA